MNKMKYGIIGFILGSLFFSLLGFAQTSTIEIGSLPQRYFFDGVSKTPPSDQEGFLYNGRTYVSLRFISEALGKKVSWDNTTKSIYVGDDQAIINDYKTYTTESGFSVKYPSVWIPESKMETFFGTAIYYDRNGNEVLARAWDADGSKAEAVKKAKEGLMNCFESTFKTDDNKDGVQIKWNNGNRYILKYMIFSTDEKIHYDLIIDCQRDFYYKYDSMYEKMAKSMKFIESKNFPVYKGKQ